LSPAQLVIEVTESTLLRNAEVALVLVEELRRSGVRVAIDDFGTGYSSLARLGQLRPSILKIDRSFVSPVQPRASTDMMLETILTLGRRLDMVVVAEGIATSAQREHLVELGCELGQGYLFSPARPADALGGWLRVDHAAGCLRASAPVGYKPL
jgi:EAL domain-containing protein (putative c-di-GMP-specific phosphodiesterase class I)